MVPLVRRLPRACSFEMAAHSAIANVTHANPDTFRKPERRGGASARAGFKKCLASFRSALLPTNEKKPAQDDLDRLFDQRADNPPVAGPIFPPEDCEIGMPADAPVRN